MSDKKKRAPRMRIAPEELEAFLEGLRKGLTVGVALTHTSWAKSSFYDKMKRDRKFSAKVNSAKAEWYTTLSDSNHSLVKQQHPETVKHNIQRMDRDVSRHDYRNALIEAQKKAISDLDFDRAQKLQLEIEKAS